MTDPWEPEKREYPRPEPAFDDIAIDKSTDPDVVSEQETDIVAHRRPRRWPGLWSFGVASAMVVVTAVAIGLAAYGDAVTALTLTVSALGLCGIAIVLGVVAIIGNWSRMWGIIGAGIALVINPLVLLYGLSAIGGF